MFTKIKFPNLKNIVQELPGPNLVLLPNSPKFTIVEVSETLSEQTNIRREDMLGKSFFEIFPDNPKVGGTKATRSLAESFLRVIRNHIPDILPVQRYDIKEKDEVDFKERYWRINNSPLLDQAGSLTHIIFHVEDITKLIKKSKAGKLIKILSPPISSLFTPSSETIAQKIMRYSAPTFLATVGLVLQKYLQPLVGEEVYLLLYPCVFIGAILSGFIPGIFATTIATVGAWYYYVPYVNSFKFEDMSDKFGVIFFSFTGILVSLFGEILRSSRAKEREFQAFMATSNDELHSANLKLAEQKIKLAFYEEAGRNLYEEMSKDEKPQPKN